MRGGETLDELEALVAHLDAHAAAYGFGPGSVRAAALCVDDDGGAGAAAAAGRWPGLAHFSLDGRGIRAFAVDRVPSRLVLDAAGGVRRRWDGAHGRVLQGRHGASLANGSHTLVRELVDVVHGPDPARRAP